MKYTIRLALVSALALAVAGPLAAYEDEWQDSNYKEKNDAGDSVLPNATFKVKGRIYSGYEFTDVEDRDVAGNTGPQDQKTGFAINRVYTTLEGKVNEGSYKGFGFRITTDAVLNADMGAGCGSTSCNEDNDLDVNLKYAYFYVPISFLPGTQIRFGQQHVPGVDGKAGFSLQSKWGHRHIAKTATEVLGMSSSTERGIALIHESDYLGLHLLLGNGEGYHHNNAEELANTSSGRSLSALAAGSANGGDSKALDLYGMASFRPTGDNETLQVEINFPFRMQGVTGIDNREVEFLAIDTTEGGHSVADPNFVFRKGDARALRDYNYGVETNLEYDFGMGSFTVGLGHMILVDRRGTSYQYTRDTLFDSPQYANNSSGGAVDTPSEFLTNFQQDSDRKGIANYIYAHVRVGDFGLMGRMITGDTTTTLDGKVRGANGKSWEQQMFELDTTTGTAGRNNVYGDLTLANVNNANIDIGRGYFTQTEAAISYWVSPKFVVSLGVSELWGDQANGKHFKVNPLDNISNDGLITATSTTTYSDQLENSQALNNTIFNEQGTNQSIDSDDYFGYEKRNRQVWIRSEFRY